MESRGSLILRAVRFLLFATLYFGSFIASLYIPHQHLGWRIAMVMQIAFYTWVFVNGYRRRAERRHA